MGLTSGGAIEETSKFGRGLIERAWDELERDGAVGRERSSHYVSGSISLEAGRRGRHDDSAGWVEQAERMCSSGINLSLGEAVDACRVRRATLSIAPLSSTFDCLYRIVHLGSF